MAIPHLASDGSSLWNADPSTWADVQEPTGKPVWISMLAAANIGWRSRVLDVGCGAGGAAGIARGLGAQVCGVDICESLVAIARQRVRKAEFQAADMMKLPCRNEGYSIVLCCNSLGWAADPAQAVREMIRVCSRDGRVVIGGWSETADQAALLNELERLAPGSTRHSRDADERTLAETIRAAGGRELSAHVGEAVAEYVSREAAWLAQRSSGWCQAAIREAGEPVVRNAILAILDRFTQPNGRVHMVNHFRFIVASR